MMRRPSLLVLLVYACGGETAVSAPPAASDEPVSPAESAESGASEAAPTEGREPLPEHLVEAIDQLGLLFMTATAHAMATDGCIVGPISGDDADAKLRSELGWQPVADSHFRYEVATPRGPSCDLQAGLPVGEVYSFRAIAIDGDGHDLGARVLLEIGSDDGGMLFRSEYEVVFASGRHLLVDSSGQPLE